MAFPLVNNVAVQPKRKMALVIGINDYYYEPLENAVNDANDMSSALESIGFQVVKRVNLKSEQLEIVIRGFCRDINEGDMVIFYFAGLAVQVKDTTLLLAKDAPTEDPEYMEHFCYSIESITDDLMDKKPNVVVSLLDSSRTFLGPGHNRARAIGSVQRGLKPIMPNYGCLIGYACAPGYAADDSTDERNGLYTKHLLKYITTPNKDIRLVLESVARGVTEESCGRQTPFTTSALTHDHVCLNVQKIQKTAFYNRKRALVIGIDNYAKISLNYCINDAKDLQGALRRLEFQVTTGFDCNKKEFNEIVENFAKEAQPTDLTLFYFAGHGTQLNKDNYILPVEYNYKMAREPKYISDNCIDVETIMDKIEQMNSRFTIFIFDCCRNYMRTRNPDFQQGLSPVPASPETLVVFACAPGSAALDETRNGRNGVFMGCLLKYIANVNKHLEEIFFDTARDVKSATGGFQQPFRSSSLTERVYLSANEDTDDRVH